MNASVANERLVELSRLRFREHSVTKRCELALDKIELFPNGALIRLVSELAAERDSLGRDIAALSTGRR
jgi:hypothetical protein